MNIFSYRRPLLLAILSVMGIMIVYFLIQIASFIIIDGMIPNIHQGNLLAYSTILTAIIVVGFIIIIQKLLDKKLNNTKTKHQLTLGTFLKQLGIAIIIWLLFFMAMQFFGQFSNYNPMDFMLEIITKDNKWLIIFLVIIVAPIYEELLFRGLIFNILLNHHKIFNANNPINKNFNNNSNQYKIIAITSIITSILFSISHLQYDAFGVAMIFIFSLLLCFLKIYSSSLHLPIFIHFLNNAVAMMILMQSYILF